MPALQDVVKAKLEDLRILYKHVDLGEVELTEDIPDQKLQELNEGLLKMGLQIIED